MTFVLTDKDNATLSERLSSFWFYLPFKIHTDRRVELLPSSSTADNGTGCLVAVLVDGAPNQQLPPPATETSIKSLLKLTLTHATKTFGTLKFDSLMYKGSVNVVRNNEWAELRMFAGVGEAKWIDTNNWARPAFKTDDGTNLWKRSFSFGRITAGTAVDATTVEMNTQGHPRAVTLIRRMITNTICAEIQRVGGIGNLGTAMPCLKVTMKEDESLRKLPELNLFIGATGHEATGYVMIAAGAFAAISADSMLSDFETISGPADAMRRLARVAWAPDNVSQDSDNGNNGGQSRGRLLRKLNNIHDTGQSGVFEGKGLTTDPVEVLHVRASSGDIR